MGRVMSHHKGHRKVALTLHEEQHSTVCLYESRAVNTCLKQNLNRARSHAKIIDVLKNEIGCYEYQHDK